MLKDNSNVRSIMTKTEKRSIHGGRTGGEDSSELDNCRNDDVNKCPCGNEAGDTNCSN
jgi:hypothetical protein